MRKYLLALALLLAMVLSSGCTDGGNQTSNNTKNKVFSGDQFTFEYPSSWQTISSQARDSIVAVGDPSTADGNGNARVNVVIQKTVKPQNETFDQYYQSTYSQFKAQNMSFVQISEGNIVINGVNARENIYTINSGGIKKQRAVWIQKNDLIYIILCSAPVDLYGSQQPNFDIVVNSFKLI